MPRLLSTIAFLLLISFMSAPASAASDIHVLPDSTRLILEKQSIRLADAEGMTLASLPIRARHADWRPTNTGYIAAVFDADRQVPLLLQISTHGMVIAQSLPAVNFALETLCLYRDTQQLNHLFLIAKDGQAEQWLLGTQAAAAPRLLRRLALPPATTNCRADDARQRLYVQENGYGVWAYAADGEGVPQRRFVGKRIPKLAPSQRQNTALPIVVATAQTAPVARSGDAADDPAIWVHPMDSRQSRVFATNKKQGLLSYDLQGTQQQLIEAGRLNNVDIRQQLELDGTSVDLAIATQRDENALAVFEINTTGEARDVARIPTGLAEIYGTCLYRTPQGGLEVFANDKDGRFEHYRILRKGNAYVGERLGGFRVSSQPEGCVVDDRNGRLFIGEEKRGIWTLPVAGGNPELILATGKLLVADVEGLSLYHGKKSSYLIASSQGNNSYVVLDALPPHKVRGAFRIGINAQAGIDGVSDTDGLDASAVNFGGAYTEGMLVVQDGYKRLPDSAQNFKYVAWRDIARALDLK